MGSGKWREVGDDRWVWAVGERKKKKREKERGALDGLVCWAFAPGWPRLSFFCFKFFCFLFLVSLEFEKQI
jgi:hypothetical protein